ncbi:uncharacterized protein LOC109596548 [Aethina tumida]|uniref:uncharacterized protein LOC109596548 n=1 Tax=Aethina tumida TaxID=116153 RepID=UPI002147F694|nr:uncharacterized protein LOC109596548 [Aethina tumida]XP_049818164.1 uncharacterized protein LOC109596548 [Aethina tumida]
MVPNWSFKPPIWTGNTYALLVSDDVNKIPDTKLTDFIEKSDDFPLDFPVQTGRCKTLKQYVQDDVLETNINSAYPIIHENALYLYAKYILYKKYEGNDIEKAVFANMTLKEFINRLLQKRAVKFMGRFDSFKLLNGAKGTRRWETIGTAQQKKPLLLEDYISYEEIKLSVFLSVSSYTYFVNVGDRKNMAKYATDRNNIADTGVIVGLIGTRLKKENVMEYQEMVIDKNQNTKENGYGVSEPNIHNLFAEFYEEKCMDYEEAVQELKSLPKDNNRYVVIDKKTDKIFDNYIYYKRMSLTVDTLLIEANHRAHEAKTTAFIHVVGLGLGVWRISSHQDKVYMDIFAERLKQIGRHLTSISDIVFSYISQPDCGGYKHGQTFKIKDHPGIKIHINKRNPHEKLKGQDEGKLLVISYAWDGNALPGNEYWDGKLGSSGDSAAASSTQITELHNAHINPKVNADNLRVATRTGVVSFEEYQELKRIQEMKRKKSVYLGND